ncbi:hypothetical protein SK069_17980 [Patulibacter brassicae]|uniref:Uncharacterized protein n=1 Tax=Patulibacter brassicae TaxID=1705717 RepID=A0ABU4VNR3_9ACTN|nr:hypothetical protein [Patulibacter brassicae]MDX8153493.1 hypothetical protein [Patulibacter brassicae]
MSDESFKGRLTRRLVRVAPWQRCEECGGRLFRAWIYPSRGQIKVLGADGDLVPVVRADFESRTRIGFRHVDASVCRRIREGGRP